MKRRLFIQTGLGLSLGGPICAALKQGKLDDAASVLSNATESKQVHAAALLVRQGEQEFAKTFGAAAESLDSMFLLASITKPICIASVMTFYERGEFGLDDLVKKFIPEFTGDGRDKITMRQLMTHVSGLPDQLPQNKQLRSQHAELREFIDGAIRTPLLFEPGSKYSYSSMAILLASEVARKITGKPIATLVDEAICQPLNLKHTAMGTGRLDKDSLVRCQVENAAPESGSGDAATRSWDWNSDYWRKLGVPWGGAHGSAGDVARFLDAFLHPQGRMLRPGTCRLMIKNHNPPNMRPRGLGFDLGKNLNGPAGNNVFGHTGSTGTLCWADPTSDSVCVVLTTLPGRAANPHPRNVTSKVVAEAIRRSKTP